MLSVDLSNYTHGLTVEAARRWKAAGIGLAIVQAVDPPAGYPPGRTRQQIEICLEAGLVVDAYVWAWFDKDDVQDKLSLLDELPIRTIWLDVEDLACAHYGQAETEAIVARALDRLDAYGTVLDRPKGIYTGAWFWRDPRYMANTTSFSDRPLWDANYDGVARASVGFHPYGGWKACAIKQYQGNASVVWVTGLDRNALSTAESRVLR